MLDLIFPKLSPDTTKFKRAFPQVCPVCQRSAYGGVTHPKCQSKYNLDGLYSLYAYREPLRGLIKKIKFNPFYFAYLAKLAKDIEIPWKLTPDTIIVPVPLHPVKKHWRGFNQAEEIAKALAKKYHLPVKNLLVRKFFTKSQKNLKKADRIQNIADAFAVGGFSEKYPAVILVDDIWTTGATLRICGKILKNAGVKTVYAVTFAK